MGLSLWIAACALLVVGGSALPGWLVAVAVAIALVTVTPLSIERFRRERNLARSLRRLFSPGSRAGRFVGLGEGACAAKATHVADVEQRAMFASNLA